MKLRDILLAVTMIIFWGANFTVIKVGLAGMPSMLLVCLRYVLVVVPAIFFVPRPPVRARYWVAYGLAVGVGQFAPLFYALEIGLPAGVASVMMQSQAFFTALLAALLLREPLRPSQLVGMTIAAAGLALIALAPAGPHVAAIPLGASLLALVGAASWGLSNIVVRQAVLAAAEAGQSLDGLALVVWSALVPPIPLLVLAFIVHSPSAVVAALKGINGLSVFSLLFLAFVSTLFGFGVWNRLLSKYPAATVAPFSMLVPVTGLITAHLFLAERLSLWQWVGCALVVTGLVVATGKGWQVGKQPGRDVEAPLRG